MGMRDILEKWNRKTHFKICAQGGKNENERIHVKIMLKNDRAVSIDSSDVELLKQFAYGIVVQLI